MHVQVQWIRRRCNNCSKVQKLCHMSSKKIPFNPFKSITQQPIPAQLCRGCPAGTKQQPPVHHEGWMDGLMDDEFD